MMDEDENLSMLLNMGFDLDEARNSLRMAKNDLNEAVAILTNEAPMSSYSGSSRSSVGPIHGPTNRTMSDVDMKDVSGSSDGNQFPVHNLYELEQRVFQDQWSIPYRRDESLGKCLIAATRLAQETMKEQQEQNPPVCHMERDEHCRKFLDRILPESFRKLLSSNATHRWNTEIQEGIYVMSELFIETITARLAYDPVPCKLLETLALVSFKIIH